MQETKLLGVGDLKKKKKKQMCPVMPHSKIPYAKTKKGDGRVQIGWIAFHSLNCSLDNCVLYLTAKLLEKNYLLMSLVGDRN